MNDPLKSDPAKQGQKLAQQIAKQLAQEPIEIAKTAFKQASGLETSQENPQEVTNDDQTKIQNEKLMEQKSKAQGQRQIQALENEIKEITEKKKMERQKEEIVENQEEMAKQEEENASPLVIPSSKKTRNIFAVFSRKPKQSTALQAERQKTRVERIMPPTG